MCVQLSGINAYPETIAIYLVLHRNHMRLIYSHLKLANAAQDLEQKIIKFVANLKLLHGLITQLLFWRSEPKRYKLDLLYYFKDNATIYLLVPDQPMVTFTITCDSDPQHLSLPFVGGGGDDYDDRFIIY